MMGIACIVCGKALPVGKDRTGQSIRCPWCGNTVSLGSPPPIPQAVRPQPPVPPLVPVVARAAAASEREEEVPTQGMNSVAVAAVVGGAAVGVLLLLFLGFGIVFLRSSKPRDSEVASHTTPLVEPSKREPTDPTDARSDIEGRKPGQDPLAAVPRFPQPGLTPAIPSPEVQPGPPTTQKFATFMGTRAIGSRICIIADQSGSMSGRGRINQLKAELEKTLRGLSPDQQFYIVFFHSRPEPMPHASWLNGGSEVDRVMGWIKTRRPTGGTQPLGAFTKAFALSPRPDVIFFMTDGMIPSNTPSTVAGMNNASSGKIPINTILMGTESTTRIRTSKSRYRSGEAPLQQIARESGGVYRFVGDGKSVR